MAMAQKSIQRPERRERQKFKTDNFNRSGQKMAFRGVGPILYNG